MLHRIVVPLMSVPRIGFGTAGLGHASEEAVWLALMAGYRHIDTAQVGLGVLLMSGHTSALID